MKKIKDGSKSSETKIKLKIRHTKCRNKKRCILFILVFNYTNTIRCIFCCCLLRAIFFFSYTHISRRDSFFFLLYRDLSFYTNYLGIVIFRFFCAFFSSRRLAFTHLTFDVQFTSQKKV